jgi:hypothetical protein
MPDIIVFERFADFIEKKPNSKKKYVSKVMNQGQYQPQEDYYLQLRQKLKSVFRNHSSIEELNGLLKKINPRKFNNYETLIDQIQNFMQGKTYAWLNPPRYKIDYSGLELTVNPEIGLSMNGNNYFIKMYFKQETMSKTKAQIMQRIMQDAFKKDFPNAHFAIWDIRNNAFYSQKADEEVNCPYNLKQEALLWLKLVSED